MKVAVDALDVEAVGSHGVEVGTPSDEADIVTGRGQPPAADTTLRSQPAVSAAHVAFIYADDLWVADLDGKNPRRLTADVGPESNPVFSPDGQTIAFSAQYEGNTDVYTIPVTGGQPTRLTWHPGADVAALGYMSDQGAQDTTADSTGTARTITLPEGAINLNMATLVGSYETVARHLDEAARIPGVEGLMFTFDDFERGVHDFGTKVKPLLG